MTDFTGSFKKSTKFFELNKDWIVGLFKNECELLSLELDRGNVSQQMDMRAGIDYILIDKTTGKLYTIASRVNFYSGTIGHLTIRYSRKNGTPTEFEKRIDSVINGDSLYPNRIIQFDSASDLQPISCIVVETASLYRYLFRHRLLIEQLFMKTCNEGNKYLSIPFKAVSVMDGVVCRVFNYNKIIENESLIGELVN